MNGIMAKIKQHPVLLSVIIGGLGLVVTIYFVRRANTGASTSTSGTSASYSDPYGNVFDANGNLIGSLTGGTTAVPQMSTQDLSTQLSDFEQSLQNSLTQWEQNFVANSSGNSGTPPVTNPPPVTTPPPINNPPVNPPPASPPPVIPPPVNNPPPTIPPPAQNQVFQKTGVWGQGGNPFTTLWYAWTQYGQPHGENLQTYENQFMQWNPSVTNPNIIQANTNYRVW